MIFFQGLNSVAKIQHFLTACEIICTFTVRILHIHKHLDANEKTILILAALLCCCFALNAEEFTSGGLNYRITGDSLPTVAGTMTNTEETVGMNETLTKRAKN